MIQRFLLLSAFVLFSNIIGDTSGSLAATNDPASVVSDLGSRAIAAMQDHLRPLGFGLTAEVLEYPGGMPGDIGFFLTWQ